MPHSKYQENALGSVTISPDRSFVAGTSETLVLTFTAGKFGIDDTGGIKVAFRQSSDMQRFQSDDPNSPGYVTAIASNGAILSLLCGRYNQRPYQNTVFVRVVKGFLRPGDTITVTMGAKGNCQVGGIRLQTAAEKAFPIKVLVDAFATHDFVELPLSPNIDVEAGEGVALKILAPGRRRIGESFRVGLVPTDRWTNPTDLFHGTFKVESDMPMSGLPLEVTFETGRALQTFDNLSCEALGQARIRLIDVQDASRIFTSNPIWICNERDKNIYWADLHAQSGETVGAGSAAEYFAFARDKAFLDATSHQGNDFQITDAFWSQLNTLYAEYHEDGNFVTLPGYEWSGNTGLGGDHNVFYTHEQGKLHRSSKVLTLAEDGKECFHIRDLLAAVDPEETLMFAHVGGRYADLAQGHDGRIVRAVEIHSSWGTFEWILHDALRLGHRPGVVSNSDDHKCRPGLTTPGAATFGAMGGLTAYYMDELSRPALVESIRSRSSYGTTGARILIDLSVETDTDLVIYADDPALGPTTSEVGRNLRMGQVAQGNFSVAKVAGQIAGTAPIERIDLFDGVELFETFRPWAPTASNRVRISWQGAEYRGRGRETKWDGSLQLEANTVKSVEKVNDFNPDRALQIENGNLVCWKSITTGNLGGIDVWLANPNQGVVSISTIPANLDIAVADIGFEPTVVEAGGLDRRLSVYKLPEAGGPLDCTFEFEVRTSDNRERALYVRVTQEDGHQAWTSPVYILPAE